MEFGYTLVILSSDQHNELSTGEILCLVLTGILNESVAS